MLSNTLFLRQKMAYKLAGFIPQTGWRMIDVNVIPTIKKLGGARAGAGRPSLTDDLKQDQRIVERVNKETLADYKKIGGKQWLLSAIRKELKKLERMSK